MAEYGYEDVIFSPKDPRAQKGKLYFVGRDDSPEGVLENANGIEPFLWCTLKRLHGRQKTFDLKVAGPSYIGFGFEANYLIRKKEENNA